MRAVAMRALLVPRRSAMRWNRVAQRWAAVVADDRFERGPAHQLRALFGDLAAHDFGVGLAMPGREPGPRAQRFG